MTRDKLLYEKCILFSKYRKEAILEEDILSVQNNQRFVKQTLTAQSLWDKNVEHEITVIAYNTDGYSIGCFESTSFHYRYY